MKHRLNKIFVIGIIIFLMLVSIPMASSEFRHYPEEEGPYDVHIIGPCSSMEGEILSFYIHFWPFWFLPDIFFIGWGFEPGTVLTVNGEEQDILFPADINLDGFQGYGQSVLLFRLKGILEIPMVLIFRALGITSFFPYQRARIIGRCNSLSVLDSR